MLKLKYYLFLCSSSTSNVWGKFDSEIQKELLIKRQEVIELTSNMLWFFMLTFWRDWCTQAAEDEELEGLHLLRQDNFVKHFFLSQSLVTMIWHDTCEGQMWKRQFIIIGTKKSLWHSLNYNLLSLKQYAILHWPFRHWNLIFLIVLD